MTQTSKRKRTVLILRASPFHLGHAELVLRALKLSEEVVLFIGSAKQPRTVKNPFTAAERAEMIRCWYREEKQKFVSDAEIAFNNWNGLGTLRIEHIRDYRYSNQRWLADVHSKLPKIDGDTYITGSDRDPSTFYLKMFPTFKLDIVEENLAVSKALSATRVREIYFGQTLNGNQLTEADADMLLKAFLPPTTLKYLRVFKTLSEYTALVESYDHYKYEEEKSKKASQLLIEAGYKSGLYMPNHVTVDAVVIQAGHILLVQRGHQPGKGLWALPGGHCEQTEWMFDGAIRELREETRIKVPEAVLRGSYKGDKMFDDPNRSLRYGRTYTRAFLFHLNVNLVDGKNVFPEVKGSDDAKIAKWFPIQEALGMSEVLFEDHGELIETMINLYVEDNYQQGVNL